jgi:hypothetical protein
MSIDKPHNFQTVFEFLTFGHTIMTMFLVKMFKISFDLMEKALN